MSRRGFAGRRVFLTGGSAGIGLEAARQLVEQGAHVTIAARDEGRLRAALHLLESSRRESGQVVAAVSMDVRDPEQVGRAAGRAFEALGDVDLLVNNAGYALTGYAWETDEADLDSMLEVNYKGMVRVVRAFLPRFMERRGGHIVNVSSVLGFLGIYGYTAYAASKFAIVGYTHCLRQEMLEYGVRVSLFYPPTTDTPGLERENRDKPEETWAVESGSNATASASAVAAALLRGIRKGRYEIPGNGEAALALHASRLAPAFVRRMVDRPLLRFLASDEGRRGPRG